MSFTNSLYDLMGLAAPVIIKGKHLLRSLSTEFSASHPNAWDYPLPAKREAEWKQYWVSFSSSSRRYQVSPVLRYRGVKMFRSHGNAYILRCLRNGKQRSIIPKNCQQHQRGSSNIWAQKSRVDSSPCHNNTPLRTLGSRSEGLDDWACPQRTRTKPDSVTYYSDNKFMLDYITNESRRFYVYVSNRVERIRRSSAPHQWKYVAGLVWTLQI